jgi:hypothetical protein
MPKMNCLEKEKIFTSCKEMFYQSEIKTNFQKNSSKFKKGLFYEILDLFYSFKIPTVLVPDVWVRGQLTCLGIRERSKKKGRKMIYVCMCVYHIMHSQCPTCVEC